MEIFGKLFGSHSRVKIIRLFLLNPATPFDLADISERSKVPTSVARKEMNLLRDMGLVKSKSFIKEYTVKPRKVAPLKKKKGKKVVKRKPRPKKPPVVKKKRVQGWQLDMSFSILEPLYNLLVDTKLVKKEEVAQRFKGTGKIKLILVAGIFIQNEDSRLDILIVGDELKRPMIETALRTIEAEIGKELSYAVLETPDFIYRLGVYDKFVRDILDFPYEVVIDRIGVK